MIVARVPYLISKNADQQLMFLLRSRNFKN